MNANFMPSLFPDPQDLSDDDFNVVGREILATFSPWASWLSDGNPFAPTPTTGLPAAAGGSAGGLSDPGSVVAVTSGGITINLLFDAAALAAPASFRAGIQQAVAILASAISDKITVNLKIDYSGTGGGAAAGPDHGLFESYSSIRTDLINGATPGDTTFNALASGSSIQGQLNVAVWNAQLKLWGLMGANDTTTDDGSATFATDINPNLLVGVALHELTHAMGRIPYGPQPDIFDFFRFTSPGTRLFLSGATAPAAYFSLDGGNTKVADYGRTSDASDFLNSGVQGSSDPFNEFYNGSTSQQLTAADLKQLDALGFHLVVPDTLAPTLVSDNPLSIQAGTTLTVTSGLLSATDNISSAAQLHYTITTAPAQGTLLLSGAATSSFTQADINNGLVSYHETISGATSDAFSFKVADSAGNTTSTAVFQINISNPNHAPTDEVLSGGVIAENSPNGTIFGTVTGVDSDTGTVFHYALTDSADGRFAIDVNTGQLTVADGLHLDYEVASSYGIAVRAVDQGGLSIDKAFTIHLTDVPGVTLNGDSGNNTLVGTPEADIINGLGGNDTLTGGGGNDAIDGGPGIDTAMFAGNRADYQVTYNSAAHSFTVVDQRLGSPEGIDSIINVEQFQFADSLSIHNFDASGALVSETFNNASGSHWVNTYDTVGNQTFVWSTTGYDPSGNVTLQIGLNHDGTHWLTLNDVNNQYSWSSATITFDAQWNETSVTGTRDDGSHSVTLSDISAAYDTATWYATPFGTNLNPVAGTAPGGSANGALAENSSGGGTETFVFNFAQPATVPEAAAGLDHGSASGLGLAAGGPSLGTAMALFVATPDDHFTFDNAHIDAIAVAQLPGIAFLHASDFLLA
jgi:Cadherin-like/Cadherin domain/RTX calcium-binding nonapeptide repeat (4 copies)